MQVDTHAARKDSRRRSKNVGGQSTYSIYSPALGTPALEKIFVCGNVHSTLPLSTRTSSTTLRA
jgi:hypothetical protein